MKKNDRRNVLTEKTNNPKLLKHFANSTVVGIYIMWSVVQIVAAWDTNACQTGCGPSGRSEACIVVLAALASLRLCSSNLAWVRSYINRAFSREVLTCQLGENRCTQDALCCFPIAYSLTMGNRKEIEQPLVLNALEDSAHDAKPCRHAHFLHTQ